MKNFGVRSRSRPFRLEPEPPFLPGAEVGSWTSDVQSRPKWTLSTSVVAPDPYSGALLIWIRIQNTDPSM